MSLFLRLIYFVKEVMFGTAPTTHKFIGIRPSGHTIEEKLDFAIWVFDQMNICGKLGELMGMGEGSW